jgi:NADH-quinone oxidoreductase subunit N
VWLNGDEIAKIGNHAADFYALFFFILCGASILTSFNNLLMLFIGIEILSIPLYILTGSDKKNLNSNEAALKYFLMGAFSTGIFLLGITFIYGATGTFQLTTPNLNPATGMVREQLMQSAGLILIFVSFNFKVSAAPFHFWTPDVYDGAPTVFTSFMATIVKATAMIAFVAAYKKEYGKSPKTINAWLGYEAVQSYASAIQSTKSSESTKINEALHQLHQPSTVSVIKLYQNKVGIAAIIIPTLKGNHE